ncbi:MAG TPA: hypothetical protein DIS96_03805 [Pusillimonas sp.]|nr:hypothetical protein [Pusillimonas sp.]
MKDLTQLHGPFIVETVLSSIVVHATKTDRSADEVAMATLLALGGFLKARGHSPDTLLDILHKSLTKAAPLHNAPEGLQ